MDPAEPFSIHEMDAIRQRIGCDLPTDYQTFVTSHGGAFIGGLVDGSNALPVLRLCDAARVLSLLSFIPTLAENRALPFAECELANLWVFDEDGSVKFIDFYGGAPTRTVADSFADFVSRLAPEPD